MFGYFYNDFTDLCYILKGWQILLINFFWTISKRLSNFKNNDKIMLELFK